MSSECVHSIALSICFYHFKLDTSHMDMLYAEKRVYMHGKLARFQHLRPAQSLYDLLLQLTCTNLMIDNNSCLFALWLVKAVHRQGSQSRRDRLPHERLQVADKDQAFPNQYCRLVLYSAHHSC